MILDIVCIGLLIFVVIYWNDCNSESTYNQWLKSGNKYEVH